MSAHAFAVRAPRVSTPWGEADRVLELEGAAGVRWVSTPSHGGILVSAEAWARMPARLASIGQRWGAGAAFEEDAAWCAVVLAFPVLARSPRELEDAARALRAFYPEHVDGRSGCGLGASLFGYHRCKGEV